MLHPVNLDHPKASVIGLISEWKKDGKLIRGNSEGLGRNNALR